MAPMTQSIAVQHESSIELGFYQQNSTERSGNEAPESGNQLEPTDGGASAWKLLCAAFMFEGVLYGFALSFGVFQNHYSHLPEFKDNPFIPFVGSITTGIAFLGAPFMTPVVRKYPKYQQIMIWVGWVLSIAGLAAGSFVNTLPGLIMTQGVLYGVGFVTFYYPIISMVNEWWVTRRGFAWGIVASASGASGAVFPFIVETLLQRWGYKTTLRAIALAMVVLTGPLLPFLKPRIPPSQHTAVAPTNWSFLKKPIFWIYTASNIAQGLGFYFPGLFLPSYASSIGLSSTTGALLLALMSIAQVLGQFTFGWLSDSRVPLNLLVVTSTLVAALSSFTLWGFAHSLAPLILFALIYGFFGFGYVSMRVRMGTEITGEPTAALATFGLFCFGQGVGNVLAGPISLGLVKKAVASEGYGAVRYRSVIIFTGVCMVLSTLSVGGWYLRPSRLRVRAS